MLVNSESSYPKAYSLAAVSVLSMAAMSALCGCTKEERTGPSTMSKTQAAREVPPSAVPAPPARPAQTMPTTPTTATTAAATTSAASASGSTDRAAAAGPACSPEEQVLFSCKSKGAGKSIVLCASKQLSKSTGYLQYRFGRPGTLELEFPASRDDSQQQFKYSHYFRFQVDRSTVSFSRGGYTYSIFENYEGDQGPATKEYGVEVTGPGNPPKSSTIACEGKVVSKLSTLGGILPCDKSDPAGDCP